MRRGYLLQLKCIPDRISMPLPCRDHRHSLAYASIPTFGQYIDLLGLFPPCFWCKQLDNTIYKGNKCGRFHIVWFWLAGIRSLQLFPEILLVSVFQLPYLFVRQGFEFRVAGIQNCKQLKLLLADGKLWYITGIIQ